MPNTMQESEHTEDADSSLDKHTEPTTQPQSAAVDTIPTLSTHRVPPKPEGEPGQKCGTKLLLYSLP